MLRRLLSPRNIDAPSQISHTCACGSREGEANLTAVDDENECLKFEGERRKSQESKHFLRVVTACTNTQTHQGN